MSFALTVCPHLYGQDTLVSYQQLRVYDGLADTIVIEDAERSGVFHKMLRTDDNKPNGGSIINSYSFDDFVWQRNIVLNTYSPDWWLPHPVIASYQLQAAIDYSKPGDIILLSDSTTYLVDYSIRIKLKRTLRGGNQSVIKRKSFEVAKNITRVYQGDSIIIVDNPSDFRIGLSVVMTNINSPNDGRSHLDNSINSFNQRAVLKKISGDTLFLSRGMDLPRSGALDSFYQENNYVFQCGIMISNGIGEDSITFDNVIFDGSQQHLNYDWRIFNTLGLGATKGHHIVNCTFRNTPSENVTVSGNTIIKNCIGENLGGSFIHISNPGEFDTTVIDSCEVIGSCLNTQLLSGHSEGVITFSAFVRDLFVTNCTFIDGREHILGGIGRDDSNINLTGGFYTNHKNILDFSNPNDTIHSINLSNNTFENCGHIISSSDDGIIANFLFSNNIMLDSGLKLRRLFNAEITNNEFEITNSSIETSILGDSILFRKNIYKSDNGHLEFSEGSYEVLNNWITSTAQNSTFLVFDNAEGLLKCNLILSDADASISGRNLVSSIIVDNNVVKSKNIDTTFFHYANNVIYTENDLLYMGLKDSITLSNEITSLDNVMESFDYESCDFLTGIVNLEESIKVYPNPFSASFNIQMNDRLRRYYTLQTSNGILLKDGFFFGYLSVDLSKMNQGLYFLTVDGTTKMIVKI